MLSFGIDTAPQSFCHSFIALSMIRCSKGSRTIGIVALMCESTIGIVDGVRCAGGKGDDGQWAGLKD